MSTSPSAEFESAMTLDAAGRASATELDAADPLGKFRAEFLLPPGTGDEREIAYFTGNSLGLQPRKARTYLEEELDDWARHGVEGHFEAKRPWYTYHERFAPPLARLVGASPHEVVAMNSLTVNLHLMMVSFYRPEGARVKVLMEHPAFPSDIYAIKTHMAARGVDPAEHLIVVGPKDGEEGPDEDAIRTAIESHADSLAMVLLGGVNYFTGQVLDMPGITEAAHRAGAICGWDLAHGAGNVPLQLHDWDADFACWCSYKYLNGGPGAISGCFVHERHGRNRDLPRFAGWWGNDPETRFRMHLEPEFRARPDADGWQLSNPPILGLTALLASLELFDEATLPALRARSLRLTAYLRALLEGPATAGADDGESWFEIVTPREDARHGAQLSILVKDRPRERFEALQRAGVMVDFREPNVVRAAPAPLYNGFEDCWRLAAAIASVG